jgi:hypothetical protein
MTAGPLVTDRDRCLTAAWNGLHRQTVNPGRRDAHGCGRLEDERRARTLDLTRPRTCDGSHRTDEAQTRLRAYLTDRAPAR